MAQPDRTYFLKTNDPHYVVALPEHEATAYLLPRDRLPVGWDQTPLANVQPAARLAAAQACAAVQGLQIKGSFLYLVSDGSGLRP